MTSFADFAHFSVVIEEFFEKWVDQIIESITDQIKNHPVKVSTCSLSSLSDLKSEMGQYIILVGGFGESPYLRRRLRQAPQFHGIQFTTPDQSG
jgi:hypothetical protein